jgi:hypothetical protein
MAIGYNEDEHTRNERKPVRHVRASFKLRTLFVTPDAAKKDFFYGLNFEYDFPTSPFGPTRFAMEVRPIIGWRKPQWENARDADPGSRAAGTRAEDGDLTAAGTVGERHRAHSANAGR